MIIPLSTLYAISKKRSVIVRQKNPLPNAIGMLTSTNNPPLPVSLPLCIPASLPPYPNPPRLRHKSEESSPTLLITPQPRLRPSSPLRQQLIPRPLLQLCSTNPTTLPLLILHLLLECVYTFFHLGLDERFRGGGVVGEGEVGGGECPFEVEAPAASVCLCRRCCA